MAPVSQRLTFGCEAVVTPNSLCRIRAHAIMLCPACSRAARSRSRSTSPQATPASGCSDTTIVSHTYIQGVYVCGSYYAHVTYMALVGGVVSELPRQSTDPRRYTCTRAPPEKHPALPVSQGHMLLADRQYSRVNRVESVPNTASPSRIIAVKFDGRYVHKDLCISTGPQPCRSWSTAVLYTGQLQQS